ncbi:hypothetical protein OOT46_04275 [Aquabacterium sp. A7-Y]|uniref:hypothetical protein n=1 Tax=Aquabacterium sp. A7-Y TaxID=1349605 RepID=UPI00223E0D02|nr:hypothetical protein [Aquabacterium sp. A7-Y]MCW7537067.1 hypothetical protein [Aquabacterium sp. A7-Y]
MELKMLDPAVEEGSYCWLISLGGSVIGVHVDNGWCVRINDGSILVLDVESKFVPLGPLLEMQPSEFSAFVQKAAATNPRFAHQISGFPRETLLKHIFHTSYSSYWPERALAWLETEQALWPRFQGELLTFSKNKVMSQRARQHAQKMLRATSS